MVADRGLAIADSGRRRWRALRTRGRPPSPADGKGEAKGVIAVTDTIREGSASAIEVLTEREIETVMITGDNHRTAARIGAHIGIGSVHAEVVPGEKAEQVARLQAGGQTVVFVGDGVNDAPALTQADLGMAMGSGTAVAVEAGDVVLLKPDARLVPVAISLAGTTLRTIKQNLVWAFGYNTAAIPLAARWAPRPHDRRSCDGAVLCFGGPQRTSTQAFPP